MADKTNPIDMTKLVTDLATTQASVITLTASAEVSTAKLTASEAQVTELTAQLTASEAQVTELTAAAESDEPNDTAAAVEFMQAQFSKLKIAKGESEPDKDSLPKNVADLEKEIRAMTADLTAILPVGGISLSNNEKKDAPANVGAFRVHSNKKA